MKKSEVKIGKIYEAKVSHNIVQVRLDSVTDRGYHVHNFRTGRNLVFKTAAKFRKEVESVEPPTKKPSLSIKKKRTAPHVSVRALAGTGKTFTEIVGCGYVWGDWSWVQAEFARRKNTEAGNQVLDPETFRIEPSEEQSAVWESLEESRDSAKSIMYCAFSKSIVTEFEADWDWLQQHLKNEGVDLEFKTINAIGYRVIREVLGIWKVNRYLIEDLVCEVAGRDKKEMRIHYPVILKGATELASKCKLNLTGWTEEDGFDSDSIETSELQALANHYDLQLNGFASEIFQIVPKVLELSLQAAERQEVDFDDQNWLPIVLNLPIPQKDLILIDEAQDLNRAKQEFCRKLGKRIIMVGDVNQAIFGFAGSDVDSIPRMEEFLGIETPLTLNETRRCGKAIVAEAQKLVPEFKAHQSNIEGSVTHSTMDRYLEIANDGDMVLCRVNAPLISEALKVIKDGRKAVIRGRNFGQSLINFVKKQKAQDVGGLIEAVENWYQQECQKENKKKNPDEAKLINLSDRRECILAFCEGALTVEDVTRKINLVFAGKQCPKCRRNYDEDLDRCPNKACKTEQIRGEKYPVGPKLKTPQGIQYSSGHRSKGLEADRVFILLPKGASIPHPMAKTQWAYEQELNLKYVMITRAKESLVWVTEPSKET